MKNVHLTVLFSKGSVFVNGVDVFAEDSNQSNGKIKPNGIGKPFSGAVFRGNIGNINTIGNFGTISNFGTIGNFGTNGKIGTINYGNSFVTSGSSDISFRGSNWSSEKTAKVKAKSKAKNSKKVSKGSKSKMALRSQTKK